MADRIITLFKLNQLGDSVVFLPTVSGIRDRFPDAEILVICNERLTSIYSASVPGISVLGLDLSRGRRGLSPRNMAMVLHRMGVRRCDDALLSFDEPSLAYVAAWAAGAGRRVGFGVCRHRLRPLLTTVLTGTPGGNVVDVNFDLARHMAGDPSLMPTRVPVGYDADDAQRVEDRLRAAGLPVDGPFVLIHPHSKDAYKCWPVDRYAALSDGLRAAGVASVVLAQETPRPVGCAIPVRDLTLRQLAALSARARLFVGNNSGPMHVAASVGTATLALDGPSPPEWNIPWRDASHEHLTAPGVACAPCERFGQAPPGVCGNGAHPRACLEAIDVQRVLRRALALIGSGGR